MRAAKDKKKKIFFFIFTSAKVVMFLGVFIYLSVFAIIPKSMTVPLRIFMWVGSNQRKG